MKSVEIYLLDEIDIFDNGINYFAAISEDYAPELKKYQIKPLKNIFLIDVIKGKMQELKDAGWIEDYKVLNTTHSESFYYGNYLYGTISIVWRTENDLQGFSLEWHRQKEKNEYKG